jgi:menaquinone-dependent protoporphyrinogen oxidase
MSPKILVAYATVYGSTEEVAQAIAEDLRQAGAEVELQAAAKVASLEGYQAVVLGAPLYMFRWHKAALRFLTHFHGALAGLPIAIFALGPFHNKPDELQGAQEQLDKALLKFPWLAPAAKEVFVGKFDPALLRFPYNLIGPLKQMPASDERDWGTIHAWVAGLGQLLHRTQPA